MSAVEYWRGNERLVHITPPGREWPEGDWVSGLGRIIGGWFPGLPIVEMGCGYGRLAPFFIPDDYIGLDINPSAVAEARRKQPHYKFSLDDGELPHGGVYLIWTVALHVPDDAIEGFLSRIIEAADAVVIGEMMGRDWRRGGNPPVFNRSPDDYANLMKRLGMPLKYHEQREYRHYGKPIDIMGFTGAECHSAERL